MSNSTKRKNKSKGWVAPTLIGLVALTGIGLFARKASAKPAPPPPKGTDPIIPAPSDATDSSNSSNTAGNEDIRFPVFEGQDGAFMLQELLQASGVDRQWLRFFLATARGESGFTSNMVLGDRSLYPTGSKPSKLTDTLGPGEANGARKAYDRAFDKGRLEGCPWSAGAYSWGSGGWLAMLPANAWYAYKDTSLRCRHPWYLLHPVDHVVVGIDFARRLMGWSAFKANPTWLTLRVGWGNPSAMDDPKAHERVAKKFGDQLRALGLAPEWMNERVTALPKHDIEELWDTLMRTFDLEPGKRGA